MLLVEKRPTTALKTNNGTKQQKNNSTKNQGKYTVGIRNQLDLSPNVTINLKINSHLTFRDYLALTL